MPMNDGGPAPPLAEIPQAVPAPRPQLPLQLVWLIPIVAALIGGWLAYKSIAARGPTVLIRFKTAEGLEPDKTRIKYKDVDIGKVSSIRFAKDRTSIVVVAELTKQADDFLVDDTRFWVVRPRIAGGTVSGLGTLLAGAYISLDVGKSTTKRRDFVGLEIPPVVVGDQPGRLFVLHAHDLGSLDIGSPVYYRHIQAGQVAGFQLDEDGRHVTLMVFIHAPYDRYVTAATRFWNSSGIDVSLSASGLKVSTESLVTIMVGGIAFQTPEDAEPAAAEAEQDAEFILYPNQETARKSSNSVLRARFAFDKSVRGLSPGAAVDFRGITIGEVVSIGFTLDAGSKPVRMLVDADLYPNRLQPASEQGNRPADAQTFLDEWVANGFQGQLRSGNLLTGQLYIAVDFFKGAPKASIDWSQTPILLPTSASPESRIEERLGEIADKLDKIPFEQIGKDLRQTLQAMDATLKSTEELVQRFHHEITPRISSALDEVQRTLGRAESTFVTAEGAAATLGPGTPLQQELRTTLRELARAAASLRGLADLLERHPEALLRGKQEDHR